MQSIDEIMRELEFWSLYLYLDKSWGDEVYYGLEEYVNSLTTEELCAVLTKHQLEYNKNDRIHIVEQVLDCMSNMIMQNINIQNPVYKDRTSALCEFTNFKQFMHDRRLVINPESCIEEITRTWMRSFYNIFGENLTIHDLVDPVYGIIHKDDFIQYIASNIVYIGVGYFDDEHARGTFHMDQYELRKQHILDNSHDNLRDFIGPNADDKIRSYVMKIHLSQIQAQESISVTTNEMDSFSKLP